MIDDCILLFYINELMFLFSVAVSVFFDVGKSLIRYISFFYFSSCTRSRVTHIFSSKESKGYFLLRISSSRTWEMNCTIEWKLGAPDRATSPLVVRHSDRWGSSEGRLIWIRRRRRLKAPSNPEKASISGRPFSFTARAAIWEDPTSGAWSMATPITPTTRIRGRRI